VAFQHGKKTGISVTDTGGNTRYLTQWTNSVDAPITKDSAEVTPFNSTNMRKQFVPGNAEQNVSISGRWATTPDGYLYGLANNPSSAFKLKVFPASTLSTATNFIHFDGDANVTSYGQGMSVDDANSFTADFQFTGTVSRNTSAPS